MNLSSTRQAIHDALAWGYLQTGLTGINEYLIYLTRVQKSLRQHDPNVDFMEAGYICAAINALDPHLCGWLRFAYGPQDLAVVQDALASKMRFDLFPISSPKKHVRLFSMAQTSLEDYRLRVQRKRDLPIVIYAQRMGVDPDNWSRDGWGDKREKCLNTIVIWDKEGVGQVSRMVKSLRGNDDEGERPTEILNDLNETFAK